MFSSAFPLHAFNAIPPLVRMNSRHKLRGIVYSVAECGTARIVLDCDLNRFHGCLLTDSEDSVAINGRTASPLPEEESSAHSSSDRSNTNPLTEESGPPTTLYRLMRVNVVDGETGDKFTIENVQIKLVPKVQEVTNTVQYWMEINHSTIKFSTSEILIGNRADVEIQRYLDPRPLLRSHSRSANHTMKHASGDHRSLHMGQMTLRVVAAAKIEPVVRRTSTSEAYSPTVIEEARDFLV